MFCLFQSQLFLFLILIIYMLFMYVTLDVSKEIISGVFFCSLVLPFGLPFTEITTV